MRGTFGKNAPLNRYIVRAISNGKGVLSSSINRNVIEDNVGCAENLESLVRAAVADLESISTAETTHNDVTRSKISVDQHLIVAQGDAGRRGRKAVDGDVCAPN